nr:hypothetical protein [uncultured Campylobacter sp.]
MKFAAVFERKFEIKFDEPQKRLVKFAGHTDKSSNLEIFYHPFCF